MEIKKQFQIISITGKYDQINKIREIFHDCGFKTKFVDESVAYNFNVNDITTIIVAILGAGGINAIISNIIQHYRNHIKIKVENGKISELEIESSMKETELENFIKEIKQTFEDNTGI